MQAIFFLLAIVAAAFWVWQFISLMNYDETAFNGAYDKIIWAAALILLNVLGAFTFFVWKIGTGADDMASQKVRAILQDATRSDS